MRKEAIQKAVKAKIALGYGRQHAFDEMHLEHPDIRTKKLADIVRYTPSMVARQRYLAEYGALLVAVGLYVALPVMHSFSIPGGRSYFGPGIFAAFPFAMMGLGIAVARYRLHVLPWLMVVTFLGLFHGYNHQSEVVQDVWSIARYVLAAIIAGLSLLLHFRLASNYSMDRGSKPPQVIFPPEDGSRSI